MKTMALGFLILAFLFYMLPVILMDKIVMPQLVSLKNTYSHAEQIAAHVAGQ